MKLDVQVLGKKVVTLFWDPDEYVVQFLPETKN